MTRSADLPLDVVAGFRRLDPAADRAGTAPEVLAEMSSRIMAEAAPDSRAATPSTLVELTPASSCGNWPAIRRRMLWAAAAVLIVVVMAGAALSGRFSSAGPTVAAPPSAGTASPTSLQPPAEGETATPVRAAMIDGPRVNLIWANGRCDTGMPLDQQLVRTEFQPTPEGLQVLIVVKDNPAGRPKNGMCRGVGVTSTATITLAAPLERAVILDQTTTPAAVVVPESDTPAPIATYVAFQPTPTPRDQLTGTLELHQDCLYIVPAGGGRTLALLSEEKFQWADNLLLVGADRVYRPGDAITLTGSSITWPDHRQVAKYSMPTGCDAHWCTIVLSVVFDGSLMHLGCCRVTALLA